MGQSVTAAEIGAASNTRALLGNLGEERADM
jgi:hypothetical protein